MGLLTFVFSDEPISMNTASRVFIGISFFCFAFFVLVWGLMITTDKTLWMNREEMQKAIDDANDEKDKFIKANKILKDGLQNKVIEIINREIDK
jgi:hypothetical protein